MTDPVLARKIETAGWSTALLGVVCIGLAAIQAVVPSLLDRLAASVDESEDPTRALRQAWSSGAGESAWVNVIFGIALIAAGIGVVRRARWAHLAMKVASWASIVVVLALAKPSLAPFTAMAGGGPGARSFMFGLALLLLIGQIAAVLWFLRFWRKPEVRAAFR